MSVLFFFHKSIRIYMEVIILGANTLYSVFCFFKALLPKQVYFWYGWERVNIFFTFSMLSGLQETVVLMGSVVSLFVQEVQKVLEQMIVSMHQENFGR